VHPFPIGMATLTLVTGIPRAGKSSFCDAVEASGHGFTHVPLDRYVRPVPHGETFLAWIASPACIAWDVLLTHLALLRAGVPCYSPRPAWERGWRAWVCGGGALAAGPGRRMEPAPTGYLLAGTHAYGCPQEAGPSLRVYVRTPMAVVAERLTGERVPRRSAGSVVRARLAANTAHILRAVRHADLIVDGTAEHVDQVRGFLDFVRPDSAAGPGAAEGGGAVVRIGGASAQVGPAAADLGRSAATELARGARLARVP